MSEDSRRRKKNLIKVDNWCSWNERSTHMGSHKGAQDYTLDQEATLKIRRPRGALKLLAQKAPKHQKSFPEMRLSVTRAMGQDC